MNGTLPGSVHGALTLLEWKATGDQMNALLPRVKLWISLVLTLLETFEMTSNHLLNSAVPFQTFSFTKHREGADTNYIRLMFSG